MSATTHTLPREGVVAVPIEDEEMPLALAWRAGDDTGAVQSFVALVRASPALSASRDSAGG